MGRGDRRLKVRHLTGHIAGAALASLLLTGAALALLLVARTLTARRPLVDLRAWGRSLREADVTGATYLAVALGGVILAFATALAWDATSLIALRTLAQTATAVSGPSAMAMILTTYPKRDRSRALGIWAAVVALSPAVGVVTVVSPSAAQW